MTDTITLTREQWNEVFDGLDLIREAANDGAMYEITAALSAVGLDKAANTITAAQNSLVDEAVRLQCILIDAQQMKPAPAKLAAYGKWFRSHVKSNREA